MYPCPRPLLSSKFLMPTISILLSNSDFKLTQPKANFWFSCGDLLHHNIPPLCFWQLHLPATEVKIHGVILDFSLFLISPVQFISLYHYIAFTIHFPCYHLIWEISFTWITLIAFWKISLHLQLPPSSLFLTQEPQRFMQTLSQILSSLFKILKWLSILLRAEAKHLTVSGLTSIWPVSQLQSHWSPCYSLNMLLS